MCFLTPEATGLAESARRLGEELLSARLQTVRFRRCLFQDSSLSKIELERGLRAFRPAACGAMV